MIISFVSKVAIFALGLPRKALSASTSIAKWGLAGFPVLTRWKRTNRRHKCNACPYVSDNKLWCTICDCYLPLKRAIPKSYCPLRDLGEPAKWEEE